MSTPNQVTGSCACHAIKFSFTLPVLWCIHCHCRGCRRHHGAAFVTWIGVSSDSFQLSGEEHLKWRPCSSISKRGFCIDCGSPIFFASTRWPDEIHIARASLHGPVSITPIAHLFFDQHVSWFPFEDALARFGGQRGVQPMEELTSG